MFALRVLSRSAPRTITKSFIRPLQTAFPKPTLLQQSWNLASRPAYASFSTTRPQLESAGQVDAELAAKFQDELALETESSDTDKLPESLKYFLDNGPFEIQDTPGEEEVIMTRKFGDEKVRISFSIADLQNLGASESDYDNALPDEFEGSDSQARGMNGGASSENAKAASGDKGTLSDNDNELEETSEPGYPVHVNVTVEKPGKGCMYAECLVEDGVAQIMEVQYFEKADIAAAQSAETQWARGSIYAGPPFGNLDEDLQVLLERYLEERGIDTALAAFVPDYIDFKEQKEYVRWLGSLKKFVEV
ncbi:Mitochondrial acidic protein mam33 [Ophidiomyces ophidiicola]|uniref:Mitochondrial acidic protein mam33 n=1 Tax=Ophidiomyces ophidiicola TaxID=1387563 RepID=UPI0020C33889|nr:Mitochondrial acidic protein mam33 [Ophidiomyces ophidiicola]KAI1942325.1 Mitochondrial acidic protein mam33 [Ophidiomyces ophidiicola]KAI2044236.1 Mitochondrial acidic protein mam33 [Ophidiomyces ophidiicola]